MYIGKNLVLFVFHLYLSEGIQLNNILHLKYAVEVEKTGSISKAAENLYMGQPHLSKAIRELEDSLGILIFNRTSKGVIPTEKGLEFLAFAKHILSQIEEMEERYKPSAEQRQRFNISVPRAGYISYAFTEFVNNLDGNKGIDLHYRETNAIRAVRNVADCINNLAIIRFRTIYERIFIDTIKEKELEYRPILEFENLVIMSNRHPLAKADVIDHTKLSNYIRITHGDTPVPTLPLTKNPIVKEGELSRRIEVYERGSELELLCRIPITYMFSSPEPKETLERFSLVQKKCVRPDNVCKDILIYRKGYNFSQYDELFVNLLNKTIRTVTKL